MSVSAKGGIKEIFEYSEDSLSLFQKLPLEVQSKIFGFVTSFDTLVKIARVSKDFRTFGWENHPIWQGFCIDAQIEIADNKSFRVIFLCALEKRSIKANKCFFNLYRDGNYVKPDCEKAYHYLESILLEPITDEYRLDIFLAQVDLKVEYSNLTKMSDEQAFQQALDVSQEVSATDSQRIKADLYRAIMRSSIRTEQLTDDKAVKLMEDDSQNADALPEDRAGSDLLNANLRY